MGGTGHNGQLKSLIERIERLEEEKKAIADDIKEVYAEAKSNGFDPRIMRKAVAFRKKDRREREEEQAILDTYLYALGMLADTPLGDAAVEQAGLSKTQRATRLSMEAQVEQVKQLAELGLITEEGAAENIAIAENINRKWGDGKELVDSATGEILDPSDPGPIPEFLVRTRPAA